MKEIRVISITGKSETALKAINLSVINSEGEAENTYTLPATTQVGNFSCPDIESKGLLDFVSEKLVYQTVLKEAVEGSRQAIELNLKKIRDQLTDSNDIAEVEKLGKLICLSYQTQTIPLFGFVTSFDFKAFVPTRCDVCKKCTYKRRCFYYSTTTEQHEDEIMNNN